MARVFSDGFSSKNVIYTAWNPTGASSGRMMGTTARSGHPEGSVLRLIKYSSGTALFPVPTGTTEIYARIYYYCNNDLSGDIFAIKGNAGAYEVRVKAPNASQNTIAVNGTTVITYASLLQVWYRLELRIKLATSGGVVEARLNGISQGAWTGNTAQLGSTSIAGIYAGKIDDGSGEFWVDDIAINDTTGTANNSWIGDSYFMALAPNADISGQVAWTTSSGTAHWSLVDEQPANNDTDYVASNTANQIDAYDMANTPAAIQNGDNITRVWVETYNEDTTSTNLTLTHGVQMAGINYFEATAKIASQGVYGQVQSDAWLANPNTGTAWTKANLDAIRLVLKK